MESRRRSNIVAFKQPGTAPIAFHSRLMQVAEISEEAWSALETPQTFAEAAQDLEAWDRHEDSEVTGDETRFGIRSLTLNVTQVCNLHCSYCAAGGDGTYGDAVKKTSIEKALPQIRFFLRQIPAGENFHIAFLGGEPLLFPEALRAIAQFTRDEAQVRGISTSFKVTTNGTLLNEKTLPILTELNFHVVVSLDGPPEQNDRFRKTLSGSGSFEASHAGLLAAIEVRDSLASLGVHSVFADAGSDIEKAWDSFARLPLDSLDYTYTVNAGDTRASELYNEQMRRILAKAWAQGGEAELWRIGNVRAIWDRLNRRERRMNHCGLGKRMLVVDARQKLWSCPWTIGIKGEQLGEGTTLDYDRIQNLQRSQIETNDCQSCWARFLCGGGCSFIHGSTQGELKSKKSDFCERTRFITSLVLCYYQHASLNEGAITNEESHD